MKKSILMLTAAALMVSCAKTDMIDSPANTDGVLIQVKSAHENVKGEVTRAPFMGNISGTNHLEAQVITYDKDGDMYADGTMIFKATSSATVYEAGAAGNPKFPTLTGTDDYTLVGLYPATGWVDATPDPFEGDVFTTDVASFTFNGTQDIMVADAKITTIDEHAAGTYPTLTFKHQLTKLEIKVKAKDAAAAAVWSELESVKLVPSVAPGVEKFATEFNYTLNGSVAANFTAATATEFSFYVIDNTLAGATVPVYTSDAFPTLPAVNIPIEEADATGSNIVPVLYTMIAPFISQGKDDLTLDIEAMFDADGAGPDSTPTSTPKTVKVSIPIVPGTPGATPTLYNTGYAYRITLTFADTGLITAEAEVIDWIDGGDVEEIIM